MAAGHKSSPSPGGGLIILGIILLCLNQRLQAAAAAGDAAEEVLLQLLERIRLERHYETLLIYGSAPCLWHELLPQLQVARVLVASGSNSSSNEWNFSSEVLLLCCGSNAEPLQHQQQDRKLQQARRLVLLEAPHDQQQLETVCDESFAKEQHNIAIFSEGELYGCRCFQAAKYVQLLPQDAVFVQQFQNMQGATIRTETDQLAPRAMLYRDATSGKLKMIGYTASLVTTFAQRVNATLQLVPEEYVIGRISHYADIQERTRQNHLDIGAVLSSTTGVSDMALLSYPYILSSYCFMVPVPVPVPYRQIYALIVHPLVVGILLVLFVILSLLFIYSNTLSWQDLSLANVLVNDRCLRGLLGQPFPLPSNPGGYLKAVCFLLCFVSLMTTTMYEAYLQSFFTRPPPEPSLHSFKDIDRSRYTVATARREANILLKTYNLTTNDAHKIFLLDDWNDFIHMRDTFNASYIYPCTGIRWRTYAEQQKLFVEPAFYYATDMCLHPFSLLCVPLRRELPYRDLFERHILYMQEFGMLEFWISRSFFDMVRLDLTPLEDLSNLPPHEDAVYLRDLTLIFIFYLIWNLIACLCFVIEYCRG